MAAAKKKSNRNGKSSAPKRSAQNNAGKRQLWSVVMFAAAIFLLCVVLIKGDSLWAGMHNIMFGLFGITTFFYPILLGFFAVVYALDKINNKLTAKAIEASCVVVLLGAAVDILSKKQPLVF